MGTLSVLFEISNERPLSYLGVPRLGHCYLKGDELALTSHSEFL